MAASAIEAECNRIAGWQGVFGEHHKSGLGIPDGGSIHLVSMRAVSEETTAQGRRGGPIHLFDGNQEPLASIALTHSLDG
jgi:hypothetical protein